MRDSRSLSLDHVWRRQKICWAAGVPSLLTLEGQNVLEDLRDQTSVPAEAAVTQDPERDRRREARVLATLRGNHLARTSRHRQGVVYARAMFVEEAVVVAAELRRSVMAGEDLAALECLGSIVGLNPTVAPDVSFGTACRDDGPAFCLDLDEGCAGYDLNRVVERAQSSTGASCHPATRIVLVSLPGFLSDEGNLSFATVLKVAKALGVKLHAEAA